MRGWAASTACSYPAIARSVRLPVVRDGSRAAGRAGEAAPCTRGRTGRAPPPGRRAPTNRRLTRAQRRRPRSARRACPPPAPAGPDRVHRHPGHAVGLASPTRSATLGLPATPTRPSPYCPGPRAARGAPRPREPNVGLPPRARRTGRSRSPSRPVHGVGHPEKSPRPPHSYRRHRPDVRGRSPQPAPTIEFPAPTRCRNRLITSLTMM